MELVFELILRPIIGVIGYIVWDVISLIFLFNLGRIVLLFVTVGRYPRGKYLGNHRDRIIGTGFGVMVLVWAIIAFSNNYSL